MSYEKTSWQTGDTVTAEKLNKLEDGVEAAGILPTVTTDDNGHILTVVEGEWASAAPVTPSSPIIFFDAEDIGNYTYNDISNYMSIGKFVIMLQRLENQMNTYYCYGMSENIQDSVWTVNFITGDTTMAATANSADTPLSFE